MSDDLLIDLGDRLIVYGLLRLVRFRLLDRILGLRLRERENRRRRLGKKPSRQIHLGAHHDGGDADMQREVVQMLEEAVAAETQFAEDLLGEGLAGLSLRDVRGYLEYVADQRLQQLDLPKHYGTKNPLSFMELQDVQELTNFFERRVASYQVGVTGEVTLDGAF